MKICLVAPRVGKVKGAFLGGSVNNVVNLSKELARKHKVHLITTPLKFSSSVIGIDWCIVHQLNVKGDPDSLRYGTEFLIKAIGKIRKLHKEEKLDVINSHSGTPKLGLVAGIAGKICNIPSMHTQYSPIISPSKINRRRHKLFSNYRLFSNPFFSKFYLSQVEHIIGISKNTAQSVRKVTNKKVKVIPPCIDISQLNYCHGKDKSKLGLNNEKVLLFLGERESKGIEVLIKAVKEIKKTYKIKAIIGAGFEKEEIEDKVKSIKDSVILKDIIEDLPFILANSDIFVAPFLNTFDTADCPLSILEAMAARKPVIASNVGGIPEIIKQVENGVLVEPGNSDKLAEAIISLLENKEKQRELGKNAQIYVEENLSAKRIAQEYEKMYKEVIELR